MTSAAPQSARAAMTAAVAHPDRIRVLRIIARMNVGGPAIHASILTQRLDPARYASTLVAGAADPGEGDYLELRGQTLPDLVHIPELGRSIRAGQDVVTLRKLIALMHRLRPHIVHTHTAKAGAVGRLAALICRVPVIVHTYHGHVLHGYFSPLKTRVFVGIEQVLARGTTRLLTVTETVRDDLLAKRVGRTDQYQVVPLGLDLDRFQQASMLRSELRRELGLSPSTPLVGIVARLVPIKAHEVFLAAAARVAQDLPDARFLIVGDGERRAELEAASDRLGLQERVRFLGWRADLDRIYADLDVVVLTSKNEGSPVALIEAMAAGRPVVSTRVGGVADVVTDERTGVLTPDGDSEAMASAIGRLLRDAGLARALGEAARQVVVQRYAASRLLDDLDRLYVSLLSARGVRAGDAR